MRTGYRAKRAFDLAIAIPMVLILSPVFVALIIIIRLTSEGPALFSQIRLGKDYKTFRFLKFRTMYLSSNSNSTLQAEKLASHGILLKSATDPRITAVGKILRKTSLDELPQLFNVIKGEMSLVGPRPLVEFMVQDRALHAKRFSIHPGITGYWQISAREKNTTITDMLPYDLKYTEDCSPTVDMKILLRTIPSVISGKGAY